MNTNKYEYPLPIGTIIVGGYMSSTTDKERYQYRVDEILGQGGFGITYKVSAKIKIGNVWQKQRITFAIKEHFVKGHCYRGSDGITVEYSKASANEVEDSLKDFLKEGERLGKICVGCENIVNVNEVFQANNTAYYVMEYIDGGDLRQYGRIDEKKAVKYICQIANAIDYIHRQKVLHLDIKPENIVLTQNPDGDLVPILIDFGVARYFSSKGGLTTTHKDAAASEGYAPQEQYAGIKQFSPEVDVYALGATLFYMLVGRTPHSAFNRIPGDIEKALPESISEQTKEALVNAMKVQAYERTKTVADFVSELKGKKKVDKPLAIKEELENGAVVKGGVVDYQIVNFVERGDYYLKYKAIRYNSNQFDNNATQKINYTVYEYFAKGICKRNPNHTINTSIFDKNSKDSFLNLAKQKTGLDIGDNNHVVDDNHTHEIFKSNGTVYFVLKDGAKIFKPMPPRDENIKPPTPEPEPAPKTSSINKNVYIGLLVFIVLVIGIFVFNNQSSQPVTQEPTLTDSIAPEDLEPITNTDDTNNDTEEGKETGSNVPVIEEPHIVEPPKQPTDEEVYNNASKNNDWETMLVLAKKGYTPACSILARHYVSLAATGENHCRAYYWAKKASKSDRDYVMNILEKYGFLVNGEPVSTCDNINYNKI